VGDPTQQFHDFEPGILPSGLFWTVPISSSAIDVSPGAGTARLRVSNLAVPDYTNFFNSVGLDPVPKPIVPSHVSFDVRWHGGGERRKIRDTDFGFVGHFVEGDATISFSVANDAPGSVTYTAVAAGQTTVGAPGVGHERNGIFFS
jgi:hypothetical protein